MTSEQEKLMTKTIMKVRWELTTMRMLLEHLVVSLNNSQVPLEHDGCPFCDELQNRAAK
jgi:hypothetical protein